MIHLPHASTAIPPEVREQFLLTDEEIGQELRVMTDHLTDELFQLPARLGQPIRFPVSRLVLDPERFESDEQEPMGARGMGMVYRLTSRQTLLRRALSGEEREGLIERWYRPHHAALAEAVHVVLEDHDRCLVIDAHSFPSTPLTYEADQATARPDICIGTDAFHTPARLADLAQKAFTELGWTVALNRPFAGALVPQPYYRADRRVSAIMIEVNRRLYLDERLGVRSAAFDACQERLTAGLRMLIDIVSG